jgi:hypothetical protein
MTYRPDWVWLPAHYVWTPSGCVFVEGYWDRPLHERGLLFAPVRFARRALLRKALSYVPRYVVSTDCLLGALFVRPATCHYYFGDYFDSRYDRRGYTPWVDYRLDKLTYDPNYTYYRHRFAKHRLWERNLRRLYVGRRQGDIPRPPQTLVRQNQLVTRLTANKTVNESVGKDVNFTNLQNAAVLTPLAKIKTLRVTSLAGLAGGKDGRVKDPTGQTKIMKLAPVSKSQRAAVHKEAVRFHRAADQRRQAEARLLREGGTPVKVTDRPRTAKVPLPRPEAPRARRQPSSPRKAAPPPPMLPMHEARTIPRHEPPRPSRPPRDTIKKPPREPMRDGKVPGRPPEERSRRPGRTRNRRGHPEKKTRRPKKTGNRPGPRKKKARHPKKTGNPRGRQERKVRRPKKTRNRPSASGDRPGHTGTIDTTAMKRQYGGRESNHQGAGKL